MAEDLTKWDPEDQEFWETTGERIAQRNLWISIPSLLCGFVVWTYWGIITVKMLNLGYPFTPAELFTLTAIAGLSGATLRIPSSFFIRIAGGRNTVFLTTALLIVPAAGTGFALLSKDTPLWTYQLLALLSGFGGGNFASSMSNISFFFPKRVQGLSLGLNAGLGNFGVTTAQVLIPLVMTIGIFGGGSMILETTSGSLIGKIPAGSEAWIQNAGFIWAVILVPISFAAWRSMNNIIDEHVSPGVSGTLPAFGKILGMLAIGLITASAGLWLMLPATYGGSGLEISKWIILPAIITATVLLLRLIPGDMKSNLQRQYRIFDSKHIWAMTLIYTMTFGSFIGYSVAFPLAIKVVFGFSHVLGADGVMTHDTINPNGPSALMYAWMGPFIGALMRPVGGWIADFLGGAKVTQMISVVMVASALGVAYYMGLAYISPTPEVYFIPFFVLFLVLFTATGIGNGSTFRSIAIIFDKEQAGPVLGWTSAVAAYGAFIIPTVFGEQIEAATPEYALYGFAAFYSLCLLVNWWFYLRPSAYVKNP